MNESIARETVYNKLLQQKLDLVLSYKFKNIFDILALAS